MCLITPIVSTTYQRQSEINVINKNPTFLSCNDKISNFSISQLDMVRTILLPNRSGPPFKLDQCPTRTELYEKKLYEISSYVGGGPVAVLLWGNSAN